MDPSRLPPEDHDIKRLWDDADRGLSAAEPLAVRMDAQRHVALHADILDHLARDLVMLQVSAGEGPQCHGDSVDAREVLGVHDVEPAVVWQCSGGDVQPAAVPP